MAALGKRDFGSFHSSNVQELVSLVTEDYQAPKIPVQLPSFSERVPFGKEAKQQHFLLDPNWTFLNHGAFGAALKQAVEAAQTWQRYCELQPLRFLDRELLPLIAYVIRRLAKFIDCDPTELVLVPNASTGINTVVQAECKRLGHNDVITILNITYGSTKKLLQHMSLQYGVQVDEIKITFPVNSNNELVKAIADRLRPETKLAIFDHISSNHGIVLPIEELVHLCHEKGIKVLVDGAHALGSFPLSIRKTGADFYVSNAHKWLCCAKGCAFLHVDKVHQNEIHPLVTSHGYGSGFSSEFSWTGLRDYSPYLALLTVLDFWEHYGPDKIRQYITSTVQSAAAVLQEHWGTGLLADVSMFGPMVMVELPQLQRSTDKQKEVAYSYADAERIQNMLFHDHTIEVPVKAIQGKLYVRISAHLYNRVEEYEKLAKAILQSL